MLNNRAKFHKNWTCTFQEITTSAMHERTGEPINKWTNQQTLPITIPPGGNNNICTVGIQAAFGLYRILCCIIGISVIFSGF